MLAAAVARAAARRGARAAAASAASAGGRAPPPIFDGELKALHRRRAPALVADPPGGRAPLSDPLLSSVAESLLDRLDDVTRSFPRALFVGAPAAYCVARLRGRGGVELGASAALTDGDSDAFRYAARLAGGPGAGADGFAVLSGGEEALADRTLLPDASHDLVVACMGLHWANDLVAAVAHCRRILRPDGLFLAALLGGETLCELRAACALAEMEREGGVSARVSPMVRVRDGGNLLGAAGMALAAVDVDAVKFRYADAAGLVEHLRAIGETAAASARRGALPRDTALAAAAIYAADQAEADGVHEADGVEATFDVIYLIGWAPSDSQRKPSARGSATVSLHDLQELSEREAAGEAAPERSGGGSSRGGGDSA